MPPVYSALSLGRGFRGFSRDDLIHHYFEAGFKNSEIVELLHHQHGVNISTRHLKRLMARMGLRRRQASSIEDVLEAVQIEVAGSGSVLGCRSMQSRLRHEYGMVASRDTILDVVKVVDPDGVNSRGCHARRRRVYINKGPNYLIHIDGFDKLKRYGFAVHGAICGFSRRILWLEVARSNNNPKYITYYYLQYLREIQGVPRCVRADRGTENFRVCDIQRALRLAHNDEMAGEKAFLFGKSTANQRIERWWRSCQEGGLSFWISAFKDLVDAGHLDTSDQLHVDCARYCFMTVLRSELNRMMIEWNQHRVRRNTRCDGPTGKPDVLFYCPETVDAVDYKQVVDMADLDILEEEYCELPAPTGCEEEFKTLCADIVERNGRPQPNTFEEALALYHWLLPQLDV